MTTKELTEEQNNLKEKIDKLEVALFYIKKQLKIHDSLFEETKDLINKSERDIDMLKRWRG